jgi:hypothetical protein
MTRLHTLVLQVWAGRVNASSAAEVSNEITNIHVL